ncbi:probable Transcriptional regulatory protein PHO23 [Nakaseomyces glabratus]|nr:Zinc finger PHD-type profile [Nakaseomyces glabratus]KAH7602398.1 Zinc finger PHD-type profile [Nakaseomyces glabratus]KAH7613788.1 Zinc finger PHD-type profile [Nakaseomyces glabratus]KAI8386639.1 Zinc finger PHD-type profile [Nakaseomyces glabratus]KAI8397826.1 Zinc finger PHD-type profile [Nakaseomyces glabratus]
MSSPANLFPGLNDIVDVLEELPLEISRYFTLLHEIDAKCVLAGPALDDKIKGFLENDPTEKQDEIAQKDKLQSLVSINQFLEELMPSFEEKMHVSSIMLESLQRLTSRMELAYEVAIKNEEIPYSLRLGVDNHPAMHLHHELMQKVDHKANSKSSQAQKSESRREAMAANRRTDPQQHQSTNNNNNSANEKSNSVPAHSDNASTNNRKRANNDKNSTNGNGHSNNDNKKRKRKVTTTTTPLGSHPKSSGNIRSPRPKTNEYGEPLYCYCNQVAYGEMVGCDGEDCELEWFHLPCIGFETIPKGKWYCEDCKKKLAQ